MKGFLILSLSFFLLAYEELVAQNSLQALSLSQAESIALQNNQPYLISQKELLAAKQRKWQSVSEYLPKIKYKSYYAYTFEPTLVENVNSGTLSYQKHLTMHRFELNQPLLSMERIIGIRQGELGEKNASWGFQKSKNDLLLQVRYSYYSTLLLELSLEVQKVNIAYLEDAFRVEKGKLEAGNSTPFEVNESKAAFANALSEYYDNLKFLMDAKSSLVQTLGIDPTQEKIVSLQEKNFPLESIPLIRQKLFLLQEEGLQENSFVSYCHFKNFSEKMEKQEKLLFFKPQEVKELSLIALNRRPEIKQKKIEIDQAQQILNRNWGAYLPEVSGFVDYMKNAGEPATRVFSKDPFSWSVGIQFSWDIFDSFLREQKIKESSFYRDASVLSYQYAVNQLEIQIRNQLFHIEEALLSYFSARESYLVAKQAMEQALDKLRFGKIAPLEYRDSVNRFAKAWNLKNRSSFSLLLSYYELRHLMGEF